VVVLGVLVFLVAVMLKPWGGSAITAPPVAPAVTAAAVVAQPVARTSPALPTVPAPTPPWPGSGAAITGQTATARVVGRLAGSGYRSGGWGIWIAGDGPRLTRDEPWTEWTAIQPEPSTDAPLHAATWPDTDICAGVPILSGGPLVLSVTTPGLPIPGRVDGWWTDGARVVSLAGSLGYLTVPRTEFTVASGVAGAPLVIRIDGATWPDGRYELHVSRGGSTFALTYCLERMV